MNLIKYKWYRNRVKNKYRWENFKRGEKLYKDYTHIPIKIDGFKCLNCGATYHYSSYAAFKDYFDKNKIGFSFCDAKQEDSCGIDFYKSFEEHLLVKVLRYEQKELMQKREFAKIYNESMKEIEGISNVQTSE